MNPQKAVFNFSVACINMIFGGAGSWSYSTRIQTTRGIGFLQSFSGRETAVKGSYELGSCVHYAWLRKRAVLLHSSFCFIKICVWKNMRASIIYIKIRMIQWIKLVGEQFTWFDFNITFVLYNTGKYIDHWLIIDGIHIKTFKYICNCCGCCA